MLNRLYKRILVFGAVTGATVLSFQNCSNQKFSSSTGLKYKTSPTYASIMKDQSRMSRTLSAKHEKLFSNNADVYLAPTKLTSATHLSMIYHLDKAAAETPNQNFDLSQINFIRMGIDPLPSHIQLASTPAAAFDESTAGARGNTSDSQTDYGGGAGQ